MPLLERIIISDFRNIAFSELEFSEGINCIYGDNGQGKTNLLDAIHCLSMSKSAFALNDRTCIRHGCESFSVSGVYRMEDGLRSRFALTAHTDGTKSLRRDEKQIQRISSHIGTLPVVMVSPQDYALVSDGAQERRRFVNMVLSQLDSQYLDCLQRYNRALAQRNLMLKNANVDRFLIESVDAQMAVSSEYVCRRRREFSMQLQSRSAEYYRMLSGDAESVGVSYSSDLYPEGGDGPVSLEALLAASLEKDLILKYTTAGPQRDDFIFKMDGYPIRKCGSQGQQKSLLIALKLAQYEIMKQACGYAPLLLLDDVFDKLDIGRISNLLKIVSDSGYGQIFISDTSRERLESALGSLSGNTKYFCARGGEF